MSPVGITMSDTTTVPKVPQTITLADFYAAVILLIGLWFIVWFLATSPPLLLGRLVGYWPRVVFLVLVGLGGTAAVVYFLYTVVRAYVIAERRAGGLGEFVAGAGLVCLGELPLSETSTPVSAADAWTMTVRLRIDNLTPGSSTTLDVFNNPRVRLFVVYSPVSSGGAAGLVSLVVADASGTPLFSTVPATNVYAIDPEVEYLVTYDRRRTGQNFLQLTNSYSETQSQRIVTKTTEIVTDNGPALGAGTVAWGPVAAGGNFTVLRRTLCLRSIDVLFGLF